jgi:uncharacterized membrane protein YgcG
MNLRWCGRLLVCALFFLSLPLAAVERILSYDSYITIDAEGDMTVRETIRVVAEGKNIRRGIYREFPTTYTDRFGNKVKVRFQMLELTRDGEPEPWHKKRLSNGVRIYAGSSDTVLSPGTYSYTFTYSTNRQIGFFENHDELYWNVTGNGWDFGIERASATVKLPGAVTASDITLAGYTGPQGAKGENYVSAIADSSGTIQASRELPPRSGLTLVMGWPKGVVAEPGPLQKLLYLLGDNFGLLLSVLAFGGSALYLFTMWSKHGRDPGKGVIFPHYEPPEGYSPAAVRYVNEMGYDDETFTAAVINLAVKGHLSITCDDDDYTLQQQACSEPLAPGESDLLKKLFREGVVLELEKSNHSLISVARSAHKQALRRDYLNKYFKTNGLLILPSIVVSALLLLVIVSTASVVPWVWAFYAGVIVLHIVFAYLLKAPSGRGRRLMDKLEGFKVYLEVAEKDDLALRHPPDLTPELFERYLPYAIALGVEQKWAEQFSDVFARLEATDHGAYSPRWYKGKFSSNRMGNFASNVSSSFSSAVSSAATPPGSSSGSSGGGSSGGGGGGGGGGGW